MRPVKIVMESVVLRRMTRELKHLLVKKWRLWFERVPNQPPNAPDALPPSCISITGIQLGRGSVWGLPNSTRVDIEGAANGFLSFRPLTRGSLWFNDLDRFHSIATRDLVDHVHSFDHSTKHCVSTVEMRLR